jgi:hypothetical protein
VVRHWINVEIHGKVYLDNIAGLQTEFSNIPGTRVA